MTASSWSLRIRLRSPDGRVWADQDRWGCVARDGGWPSAAGCGRKRSGRRALQRLKAQTPSGDRRVAKKDRVGEGFGAAKSSVPGQPVVTHGRVPGTLQAVTPSALAPIDALKRGG